MAAIPDTIVIRPLRNAEIDGVVALYNEVFASMDALYSVPLSVSAFREKVLQHPDYSPKGSLVALDNGVPVAYGLAGARVHALDETDELHGASVVLLLVHPTWQRRGIGSELLRRLVEFARTRSRSILTNHPEPASPFAFFGGCREHWTSACAFFERSGFREVAPACTCRCDLADYEVPASVRERLRELEGEGIRVEPCGEGLGPALVEAARSHDVYWALDCHSKVQRLPIPFLHTTFMSVERGHLYGSEDVIVAHRGEAVLAFCVMARNPGGGRSFLGPLWTHPDHRRRGLGAAVLHEALRRERELHGVAAVDVYCSESLSGSFFARHGFSIAGHWRRFERPLAGAD